MSSDQTEEGVAAGAARIGARTATDLALRHLAAEVVFEPLVCSGTSGRSSTIKSSA